MKIKNLHISGFGNVKDQEFNLSQFTQVIAENGKGKTTLANFIENMLYGMNAKNSSDRNFMPWNNSSVFGGTMEFEINGETYKIERTFGQKKANDTFKLLKNGKPSTDFSEDVGFDLFNLDRESFHRICFFDQSDYNKGSVFISQRLNSIICATDEFNDFNSVCKKLESEIKGYQGKYGNKGEIPTIKQYLSETQAELRNLAEKKDDYFYLKDKLHEQKENRENKKTLLYSYEKERDELLKQLSSSKTEVKIETLNQTKQKIVQKLQKIEENLNGNNVSTEQVDVYIKFCEEIDKKTSELKSLTKSFLPVQEKPLPTDQEIENAEKIYQKTSKFSPFSFVLPLILAMFGIALFAFGIVKNKNIPLLVVAIIAFIGAVVLGTIAYKNKSTLNKQSKFITDFLGKYGYMNYSPSSAFKAIKTDKTIQLEQLKQNQLLQQEIYELQTEISSLNGRTDKFINGFNIPITDKFSFLYGLKNILKIKEEALAELKETDKEILKNQQENENCNLQTEYQEKIDKIKLLKTEIDEIDENISKISQQMAVALINSDKYDRLQLKEQSLTKELEELITKKEIAEKTLEYLKQAKENLTKGCFEPLKNSLKKYCEAVFPTLCGVTCDENFNVTFLVNGFTKDSHFLSLGQQQLVNFSLRLGLIDSLFPQEKPFIIIDDAFCPLDEKNFDLCKKLIKEISKNLQVIYLAPHKSRNLI